MSRGLGDVYKRQTAITLRAKTGIDHWTITVRGGTLRVDVTDEDVKLTGSATIVGKIELL